MEDKVEVENVNHPGKIQRVDGAKYRAMRAAMLEIVPGEEPGFTADQIRDRVRAHLPDDLFPGGSTSGWWVKCVQLDLEAKGALARKPTRPLTFVRTG